MATFSDLPTEMKTAIFAYIRQNHHRKAVCLVSRQCRDIMRPFLWETLYLKGAADLSGDLACLLNSDNGVLPHVRYIDIYTTTDPFMNFVNFDPVSSFGVAVRLIIGALQKDCLLGLSIELTISMSMMLSLLQSQRSLKVLRLRKVQPDESSSLDMSLTTHNSWVAPTLNNIWKLRIPISIHDDNAYITSAYLLKNTPRLQSLCLIGEVPTSPLLDRSREHDAFGGPYPEGADIQILQLNTLQLLWLNLQTYPASLFSCINFSGLRVLSISQCRLIGPFLTALVTTFPRATALRSLEISVIPGPVPLETEMQAIEAMVASAPSLEKLWLNVGTGRKIKLSCLVGLGRSLRRLALSASPGIGPQPPPYYTSSELGKLLKQIPRLEELAIYLCPIALGAVQHLAVKFRLPEQAEEGSDLYEVKDLLGCIATHKGLRTLRAFSTPSIDCGTVPQPNVEDRIGLPKEYVYTAQIMMHSFATEIFRYLAKHGSKIRNFIVSSDFINVKRPVEDENGHRWPRYYYKYGIARTMGGEEHVVAIPVPASEMPPLFRPNRSQVCG